MRARAPSKLRTHVLWALVVLFVVFLHLRGRSLEHAAATSQHQPGLVVLNTDSRKLKIDSSASGSETLPSHREHILAFVGVQVRRTAVPMRHPHSHARLTSTPVMLTTKASYALPCRPGSVRRGQPRSMTTRGADSSSEPPGFPPTAQHGAGTMP